MRTLPIRRKLFAVPALAAVLILFAVLWTISSSRRYDLAVREVVAESTRDTAHERPTATLAVLDRVQRSAAADQHVAVALLSVACAVLLLAAWLGGRRLSGRLQSLRDNLAYLLDRAPSGTPTTPDGDEIQALSDKLNKAIFRGRERETQMRRSSEFLEFAQAAGGFGVFDLDLVTGQVTGTPLFFELIGLSTKTGLFARDEWLATVHPEDYESVVSHLNAAIPNGGQFQADYRTLLANGEVRWLAGRGQVLMDAENLPARAIGTLTDITKRKQLEDRLNYTSESLNLAQAVAGVATMDLDFGRKSWISSDNFFEILGISPFTRLDDLDAHLAAVHPDDRESVRNALVEATADQPSFHCEYRVVLPDDTERWIAETASVRRDGAGKLVRITGALVDVTHVKRAELTAAAANRAKSDFLANVSHEIRTPMNGVIGMSQILSETALDQSQREYVDIIRGSAHALLALINDVLDFSKIEAGRLDLENVAFDLRDVVYETVGMMALQSAVKGIELIVSIGDIPVLMRGDPGRLRQVILNLLGNAIKFTHQGHIVLTASAETRDDGAQCLRLDVTDTGIGIPADRIDRLFKIFSQIDSSTTRHYGGSGLGLSIVKRLAELMGGACGVTSEPGHGSTFWVTVRTELLGDQPGYSPVGSGRKILVVDDVAASRDSLALKLRFFNFDAITVGSAEDALSVLDAGETVGLVLADELMPKRGGINLLAALRQDPRFATLPFVLLSLFGAEHDIESWAYRPDAVASKPIRASRLADLLNRVFSGESTVVTADPERPLIVPKFVGHRVLLVEDNPVNQKVAQHTLQKLAIQVTTANNGAEALERLAEARFDAVLMDCQMPVMDGFTATRRIRELEAINGIGRTPVIALTANVSGQDRENCIAAGMDAHLGKPFEPGQLADCLRRYWQADDVALDVDLSALRELTGGDLEFERELVETFVSSGDQCLAEIVTALRASDYETIGKRAHALKGASANIHAHTLSAAASHLETAARSNSILEIDGLVRQVGERLRAVNAQLSQVS